LGDPQFNDESTELELSLEKNAGELNLNSIVSLGLRKKLTHGQG
jgi:hypothetical protein